MTTRSYSVPVSLLRQYCFCPRIVFFSEIMGVSPASPMWVSQGVDNHLRQSMLEKRRGLAKFGLEKAEKHFHVELKSARLRLHGVADAVLISDSGISILEFKPEAKSVSRGQIIQAVAYGLLAEEQFGIGLHGVYILHGQRGKTKTACDIQTWRAVVLDLTSSLHKDLEAGIMPPSDAASSKCGQCEYINFCADRDLNIECK